MCHPADNVRDLQSDVQRLSSLGLDLSVSTGIQNESIVGSSWSEGNQRLLDQPPPGVGCSPEVSEKLMRHITFQSPLVTSVFLEKMNNLVDPMLVPMLTSSGDTREWQSRTMPSLLSDYIFF